MLGPLLDAQAKWLAPARGRLLRRVAIAHRRRVLDLGAGYGAVTGELVRRSRGLVVALDHDPFSLREGGAAFHEAVRVGGDALRLPLAAASLDLVFCQCVLMWLEDLPTAVAEIRRVLEPGGALVALEPDYGGMMEQPPAIATRDLWTAALERAGADPLVGRKLPALLADQGFEVQVNLLDELQPPHPARFNLLRSVGLTAVEEAHLQKIEAFDEPDSEWGSLVHLPFFLVTAQRR